MSEYDNTNRGAIFRPHDDQKLIGQGRVNVNGQDFRAVLIAEPVRRDGTVERVLYIKAGPAFVNDKKGNDSAPDYSGPMDTHPGMRFAGWSKTSQSGERYLSISVSARDQGRGGDTRSNTGHQGSSGHSHGRDDLGPSQGHYHHDPDDEIPF